MHEKAKQNFVPGELIVRLTPEAVAKLAEVVGREIGEADLPTPALDSVDELLGKIGVRRMRELDVGGFLVRVNPDADLDQLRRLLEKNRFVEAVDLNYLAETSF